jgi:hypothetical protein
MARNVMTKIVFSDAAKKTKRNGGVLQVAEKLIFFQAAQKCPDARLPKS